MRTVAVGVAETVEGLECEERKVAVVVEIVLRSDCCEMIVVVMILLSADTDAAVDLVINVAADWKDHAVEFEQKDEKEVS